MAQDYAPPAAPARPKKKPFEPPALTQDMLDAFEAEHDDVFVIRGTPEIAPWLMVLRRPTRPEWIQYKSASRQSGSAAVIANDQLVRALVVFPPNDVVEVQFRKWASMADGIVNNEKFKEFIGVSGDADLKG